MSHTFNPKILNHLGSGLSHLQRGSAVSFNLQKFDYANVGTVEGLKHFYFETRLTDIDTDGAQTPGIRYEATHKPRLSIDDLHPHLMPVIQSNAIQFLVVPGDGSFRRETYGIELGDVAILMNENGALCAAAILDTGPKTKIGEISLAAARALRYERVKWKNGKGSIRDVGIGGKTAYLVFPGSAPNYLDSKGHWLPLEAIQQAIHDRATGLFSKFGGIL